MDTKNTSSDRCSPEAGGHGNPDPHLQGNRLLYNMCLGLDNLYSEPIDGLDESIRKKVHVLFMVRWNTFDAPVHSVFFLMDKAFCHMDHDSVVKLELI